MDKEIEKLLGPQQYNMGNKTIEFTVKSFLADYDCYVGKCLKNVTYSYGDMDYVLYVRYVHKDDLLKLIAREIRDMERRRAKVIASMLFNTGDGSRHQVRMVR